MVGAVFVVGCWTIMSYDIADGHRYSQVQQTRIARTCGEADTLKETQTASQSTSEEGGYLWFWMDFLGHLSWASAREGQGGGAGGDPGCSECVD